MVRQQAKWWWPRQIVRGAWDLLNELLGPNTQRRQSERQLFCIPVPVQTLIVKSNQVRDLRGVYLHKFFHKLSQISRRKTKSLLI